MTEETEAQLKSCWGGLGANPLMLGFKGEGPHCSPWVVGTELAAIMDGHGPSCLSVHFHAQRQI